MSKTNSDTLPALTLAAFHILLALNQSEIHGYALMQTVRDMTSGAMKIGPGTLYRSLQKLVLDKLIQEYEDETDDERRKCYQITEQGRRAARAEALKFARLTELAELGGLIEPRQDKK